MNTQKTKRLIKNNDYMKKLNELLRRVDTTQVVGPTDIDITGVLCDSRQVRGGELFVAVVGVAVDAHRFIPQVTQAGAAAILCQKLPETLDEQVTYVVVPDSTSALALVASEWYDRPSEHLRLVGVTGTNGKTTTATLLYEMMQSLGYKAGLLSTVKNLIDRREEPAAQTTPDHLTLNRLLHEMVEAGCDYAFMEVSSHACVQHRIDGLHWAGGVFTNLTQDHLDFHKTMDEYLRAKKTFFDALPETAFALVNADDKVGKVMLQNCRASHYTYALRTMADFNCKLIEERIDGMSLQINGREVEVMLTGRFNAYNLTAIAATAILLGIDRDEVLVQLSQLHAADGRFQTLHAPKGFTAIVDYAHTPDALINVLDTIRDLVRGKGQIIAVCGCGGDRDATKRPIMAHAAATRSDRTILTSDNPRTVDPESILRDMEAGLTDDDRQHTIKITDRREAIRTACLLAQPCDVVLVAGKGHETYQDVMGVKHHFDDREVLRECFN